MKKIFTLFVLVLMSCMGAWAQHKEIGTPITSVSELTDGEYVISAWSKAKEGLLIGNEYANISTTTVTSGTVITDATWIWTVEKNGDTFTLAKSNGDKISVQGREGVGRHNVQWVSGGYDAANFTMNTTVVSIGGVNHWMLHQQNQMVNATNATDDQKMAYLHCNYTNKGIGDAYLRLSWWEGYNAGTGSGVSCDKFAFYPVVNVTAEQEQLSSLIQTVESDFNAKNNAVKGSNLTTTASQYSSNASDASEGTSFAVLYDNNDATFWHSDWHNTPVTTGSHYIQVDLNEVKTGSFMAAIVRRWNSNEGGYCADDNPTTFRVEASEDNVSFTEIVSSLSFPYSSSLARNVEVTNTFELSNQRYVRFWCTATNGRQRGYFHLGEFKVYNCTPAYNTTHPELAAAIETALTKARAALSTATQADIDALQRVYDMYRNNSYSATITAGNNGNFGTLCLPYATTVPVGVNAYTLTSLENDQIVFTKAYAAGSTLPAEEAVLLVSDNAGSYDFVGTTNTAKVGTNLFLGTPNAEAVDMSGNDIYVLAMDGSDICFMRTSASNVNPYKAYIKSSLNLSAKAIKIDFDGPTAINGTLNNSENTIFDLSGRKVSNARNGFYIVNGKKVIR